MSKLATAPRNGTAVKKDGKSDATESDRRATKPARAPLYEGPFDRYPGEVELNAVQIDEAQKLFLTNTFIKQCRNITLHSLIKNGIKRTQNTKELDPSYEESLIDNEFLLPLCQAALDTILVLGVLPVVFISDSDDYIPEEVRQIFKSERLPPGVRIPIVPRWGTYTLSIVNIRGHTTYRFRWRATGSAMSIMSANALYEETDPTAIVYDHFSWSPTTSGHLTSPVASLLPTVSWINHLMDCAANAETLRCNPIAMMEPVPNAAKAGGLDNCETGAGGATATYADADQEERNEQDEWHSVGLNGKMYRLELQMFSQYQKNMAVSQNDMEAAYRIGQATVNQFRVPEGRRVGHQLLPEIRPDLVQLSKLVQEQICAALGVPRSYLINDTVVRANVEGMNEQFHNTISQWKQFLDYILTDLHDRMYGKLNIEKSLVRRQAETGSIEDVRQNPSRFFKENRVQVTLAVTPILRTEDLMRAMYMGWIDEKTAGMMYLRQRDVEGITVRGGNFLTDEDRKIMLGAQKSAKATESSGGSSTSEGGGQKRKREDPTAEAAPTAKRKQ